MWHLKNAVELILYASISCGAAFFVRLFPIFFYPVLLLRVGIIIYCGLVIFHAEGNKTIAALIGTAVMLGLIGGYWDYIEVLLNFDATQILGNICLVLALVIGAGLLYTSWSNGQTTARKK